MRLFLLPAACMLLAGCGPGSGPDAGNPLQQARTLMASGRYTQALVFYEDALLHLPDYDPRLQMEYAEAAVLAAQSQRSRSIRRKAQEALEHLTQHPGDVSPRQIGELWRRLGWEMARDADSLQAYAAFGTAVSCAPELAGVFEEEWLLRGSFAAWHLALVSSVPEHLAGTPGEDSVLAYHAEAHLLELDRIPLVRTDLRIGRLRAAAMLMGHVPERWSDELQVLTELDRLGEIDHGWRQRRMELLLRTARRDLTEGQAVLARERLLEVWNSSFTGARVEAAVLLGEMAQGAGDPETALQWYTRACQVSPGLTSTAAQVAAARRDSLRYLMGP